MDTKNNEEKRRKTKKNAGFPVTYGDWYQVIRELPGGCWWAVLIFLVALVIKLIIFGV